MSFITMLAMYAHEPGFEAIIETYPSLLDAMDYLLSPMCWYFKEDVIDAMQELCDDMPMVKAHYDRFPYWTRPDRAHVMRRQVLAVGSHPSYEHPIYPSHDVYAAAHYLVYLRMGYVEIMDHHASNIDMEEFERFLIGIGQPRGD